MVQGPIKNHYSSLHGLRNSYIKGTIFGVCHFMQKMGSWGMDLSCMVRPPSDSVLNTVHVLCDGFCPLSPVSWPTNFSNFHSQSTHHFPAVKGCFIQGNLLFFRGVKWVKSRPHPNAYFGLRSENGASQMPCIIGKIEILLKDCKVKLSLSLCVCNSWALGWRTFLSNTLYCKKSYNLKHKVALLCIYYVRGTIMLEELACPIRV